MRDPVETYMNLVPMVVEQTNRGERAGVAVPQLYVRDTVAVPAPRKLELRGFERLTLQPGELRRDDRDVDENEDEHCAVGSSHELFLAQAQPMASRSERRSASRRLPTSSTR